MSPVHDVQLPVCSELFRKNDTAHETLFRKSDELRKDFTEERITKAREMAELQTKVLIYSAIGSMVASGVVMGIIGLIIYVIQTKIIR